MNPPIHPSIHPTDGRMVTPSYRAASLRLKTLFLSLDQKVKSEDSSRIVNIFDKYHKMLIISVSLKILEIQWKFEV